jgi:hypothetical protein
MLSAQPNGTDYNETSQSALRVTAYVKIVVIEQPVCAASCSQSFFRESVELASRYISSMADASTRHRDRFALSL